MKRRMTAAALLLLAGCGAREELKLAEGKAAPPTPYGAQATPPTADDLLSPPPQTRPGRSDDLIQSSDKRRSDEYDLPPSN